MEKIFSLLLLVSLLQASTPQANVTAIFSKKVKEILDFNQSIETQTPLPQGCLY